MNLNQKLLFILTVFISVNLSAQLKVGSNPTSINVNTNLQVEAQSGGQVVITRDSGKVGIGTLSPATKLDVIGKVKITDGTEGTGKVLVSDANGQASWQNASTLQAITKDSTSASNGLTLSGKDVQLGGTLTKATTITTSATNTIAIGGLQSGALTDSILVVNPSTGVVARKSAAAIAAGATTNDILYNSTTKILTSTVNGKSDTTLIDLTTKDSTLASNGLTLSGKDVQLGGTLTKATTITTSAMNTLALGGLQSGALTDSILVVNPSTGVVARKSAAAIAAGATTNEILFNSSSKILTSTINGKSDTTLIDFSSIDSTSTSNGLTLSGKDVQLGGTLTKATTITTSATNTLALGGLQSGVTSDSILVVNPSTNVVKRISASALGAATEPWYDVATNKGATLNTQDIYQLGKVGIGTKSPLYDLYVLDSTATNLGALNPIAAFVGLNSQNNAIQVGSALSGATIIGINGNTANGELLINSRYIASPSNGANIQLIDGAGTTPKAYLTATATGVGIGTTAPTNKLHVKDTINNNPLRLEGLTSGDISSDSVLVSTSTGIVKRVSLTSAVDNSVGAISIFPYSAIPSGYLECNGQAVSRTTYAMLFSKIGTTYGAGNGSTTFNLPDLRGEFVRGWDNGRGVDPSRTIGSKQNGTAIWSNGLNGFGSGYGTNSASNDLKTDNYTVDWTGGTLQYFAYNTPSQFTTETLPRGIARPRNVAMVYAIKAIPSLNFTSGGGSSSATEPWYSAATSAGATLNTENIYQMGNVGIKDNNPTSTLDVNGSLSVKYNAISATSYTINNQDYFLLYNGTANSTFTLPAGTLSTCNCSGRAYEIINSSSYNITLNANTSELVENAASIKIAPNQTLKIVNNGGASGNTWNVINYGSKKSTSGTYEIASTAFNGKINTQQYMTLNSYQPLNSSDLVVTVPSGYANNRIILRWDLWGDAAPSNSSVNGWASLMFAVENVGNTIYGQVAYETVHMPVTNATVAHRWTAPIAYYLTNVAPGTYTFKLLASFIDNVNCNGINVLGVSAQGSVYVQNP